MYNAALALLRTMLGPQADFRRHQWEAIESLVVKRQRILVLERKSWGKSVVYLIATKLLRQNRAGPTLLISPLLSLMRDQLLIARKIGLRAATIHSGNRDEWEHVEYALEHDACDILLVSPERLNNERFRKSVLPALQRRIGLLVVNEAICISEWGNDFRPDFRRIGLILARLSTEIPVLATAVAATNRVIADIREQLGDDLVVTRGPLARATLRLQNLAIPQPSARLAWLAENVPKFPGSGVIHCLTIEDVERVAAWLRSKNIDARAYHGVQDHVDREALEHALFDKQLKALVATAALGLGFDKSRLSFVIHFQRAASVMDYYHQVGRAGDGSHKVYGILLRGEEDDRILNYFIESAAHRLDLARRVIHLLEHSLDMTAAQLLAQVNANHSKLEVALKTLEIDGAIGSDASGGHQRYFRTTTPWKPDFERLREWSMHRQQEREQMGEYARHDGCLMEFLAKALGDPDARPCGVCANCQGCGIKPLVDSPLVNEATRFLERFEQRPK